MFVACRPCIWACLVQCKYSSGCGKNLLDICFGMGIVGSVFGVYGVSMFVVGLLYLFWLLVRSCSMF